jgi:hypothetical protein
VHIHSGLTQSGEVETYFPKIHFNLGVSKMTKFIGTPNLTVIDYGRNNKVVGRFDADGIMEVTDELYCVLMKKKYRVVEEVIKSDVIEKPQKRVCKKCGKEFDGQGALLTHYRTEHKGD